MKLSNKLLLSFCFINPCSSFSRRPLSTISSAGLGLWDAFAWAQAPPALQRDRRAQKAHDRHRLPPAWLPHPRQDPSGRRAWKQEWEGAWRLIERQSPRILTPLPEGLQGGRSSLGPGPARG